jgi:hypothetical protein
MRCTTVMSQMILPSMTSVNVSSFRPLMSMGRDTCSKSIKMLYDLLTMLASLISLSQ